eukprot:gnl/MRDRNA2_/MRDRNA2_99413_c0_seq1.p1 gnl/MRDRNA2_/MRDRNA2_99413_c0~~gnl/MRDRNA2_/MRDRNA2_99413_c0_seq1.p1  ORF type:complete len:666 (+),score=139.68 gnl/MRDRNA2_/MRDRNA2_99413_c0_seq1:62-2059(+)
MGQETGLISCEIASLLEKCSATELQSLLAIFEKKTIEPPVVSSLSTTAASISETQTESTAISAKTQEQVDEQRPEDLLQSAAIMLDALDSDLGASQEAETVACGVSSTLSISSERQIDVAAKGSSSSQTPHRLCGEQEPVPGEKNIKELAPSMDDTANAHKSMSAYDQSGEAMAASKNATLSHTSEGKNGDSCKTEVACDQPSGALPPPGNEIGSLTSANDHGASSKTHITHSQPSETQPPPTNAIVNHSSLSSHGKSSRTAVARDESTEGLAPSATDMYEQTSNRNNGEISKVGFAGDHIDRFSVPSENVIAEIASAEIIKPSMVGDELRPVAATLANDDAKLASQDQTGHASPPSSSKIAAHISEDALGETSKALKAHNQDCESSHGIKVCAEDSEALLPSANAVFTSCSEDQCDQGDISKTSKLNTSEVQSASGTDNSDLLALLDSCRSITPEAATVNGVMRRVPDMFCTGVQTEDLEVAIGNVQAVNSMQHFQASQIAYQPTDPVSGGKLLQGSGPQVLEQVNRLASSFAPNTIASLLSAKSAEVAALQAKLASLHESLAQQDGTLSELGTNLEKKVGVMRRKRSDLEFQQLKLEECMSENFALEETCMVLNARFARLSKEVETESIALQERPNTSSSVLPIQGPSGITRSLREKRSSSKT